MGGSKQTTENKTTYDPEYMARINSNYDRTKSISESPFQAYTGERVAGLTPTQTQARGIIEGVANDQTGASTLNQAKSAYGGILNFQPQTINAGQISDTDLSKYMNPFTQSVIDTSLADLSRSRDVQRVADNQKATAAGAFGGSRQGVADSLTNADYLRTVASTTAGLRSAGYDKAVGAATDDLNRRFSADTANAGNDITGAGVRMNGAAALSGISDQELRQALQRAGALSLFGEQEQGTNQARNDAAYEEFLRGYQDPFMKQQLLNSALGAYPVQGTTTSTQTSSPGLGGILSGAGSAATGIASLVALSDERAKSDVRTIRHDAKGRRWVSYRYNWEPVGTWHEGVIAQEILRSDPNAVLLGDDGLYRVDYSKLGTA